MAATCGTSPVPLPARLTGQSAEPGTDQTGLRTGEKLRAAAVQLNSTDEYDRNLEVAERLVRGAAADGAELVVLPEKWTVLGPPEAIRASAEPLDGPALSAAAGWARELGVHLVAGSVPEVVPDQEKLANTSVMFGPDGEQRADLPQDPHVRRRGRATSPTGSRQIEQAGRSDRARRGWRHAGRPDHLLRPPLPRALPDPRPAGRPRDHRSLRLHRADRPRSLGGPDPRPGDRGPGLHGRRRPDRRPLRRTTAATAAR